MPDGHCLNILMFTAASVFRVGACFEVSLFFLPFPLVPVLTGLLAPVDVKEQYSFIRFIVAVCVLLSLNIYILAHTPIIMRCNARAPNTGEPDWPSVKALVW